MYGFTKAKKTQVKTVVIAGKTVVMRMKWNSEHQEYECAVKIENASQYSTATYFTCDWIDGAKTLESMAHTLVENNH